MLFNQINFFKNLLSHDVFNLTSPVAGFIKLILFFLNLVTRLQFCAPHMVCKTCTEVLYGWINGKNSCLKFGIPMVWRETTNHATDWHFCAIYVTETNRKNRSSITYPDLESACRHVAYCDEISISLLLNIIFLVLKHDDPHPFSINKLNELVRDLSLSQSSAELLVPRFKFLCVSACITFYRNRHQQYLGVFSLMKRTWYTV